MLFSEKMVAALLAGTKTQTRRMITPQTETLDFDNLPKAPHAVGDVLSVRETFYAFGYWEFGSNKKKKGKNSWNFVDRTHNLGHEYRYAENPPSSFGVGKPQTKNPVFGQTSNLQWYKRPSLFMPADAVRLQIEITRVRVQQLKSISESDALAEGITADADGLYPGWISDGFRPSIPEISYFMLWDSINGAGSHNDNPWVFVYNFNVIKK